MIPKSALARRLASSAVLALIAAFTVGAQNAVAQDERGFPGYGRPYSKQRGSDDEHSRKRQHRRDTKHGSADQSRNVEGAPLLAVVALGEQRVTIYNAHGKMLQSPVSTGAKGLETPAGIYSVVQKEESHQSNVYEDGNMPFMERITWTGIALHGGVLPGYPASHGCIRLPQQFAQRLYRLTDVGMRVVVVRDDIAPAQISHPTLFAPLPWRRGALIVNSPLERVAAADTSATASTQLGKLKAQAATKSAEADAASKKAAATRQVAAKKAAEAANAVRDLRMAESATARAEEALKAAVRAIETASSGSFSAAGVRQAALTKEKASAKLAEVQAQFEAEQPRPELRDKAEAKVAQAQAQLEAATQRFAVKVAEAKALAEAAKEKAAARLSEVQAQLAAARSQVQVRADESAHAEVEAKSAETARELAAEASEEASQNTSPVSVFVSRKTQRLYVRQGYVPIFEAPVTIRDAEKPIGSYVYTALGYDTNGAARWSILSMYKASGEVSPQPARGEKRKLDKHGAEAAPADVAGAKAALDRIAIPEDVFDRFSEVVLPGASLIISDEGASIETGKDTDFVVLMSGEPQGGIKTRHVEQRRSRRVDDDD
jgi:L,D-transpeptidase catalytic domain